MNPEPSPQNKLLLDIQTIADLTGFSVGTLYHFVSQRRIPFVRISSRCIRFERSALESWIAGMAVPTASVDSTRIPRNKRDDDKRFEKMNR
jgi:excisionase family DNA binding protein